MVPGGQQPLRVTTNVSPRQIGHSDFIDDVRVGLELSAVDPSLIYLELTETSLIADPRAEWTALTACRELGIGLALDDFGTGYSSLSHLRNFDLELLKLDGTYISGLGEREIDEAIVRHVVSLARALGIAILAEGVQNETQFERLLEMRCELGQGYFFSEPQPPTIIEGLLHRQINAEPVIDAGSAGTGPMMERAPAAPAPADDDDGDSSPAPVVLPKLRKTTLPSKG